jgi:hypothetical protein
MNKSRIQVFIENLVLSSLTILKILLLSNFFIKRIRPIKNKTKECVILGNGPSLKNFIKNGKEFLANKDLFVVNFFWKSEYYEVLKPKYYMIISTNYWSNGKVDYNEQGRKETFKNIAEKTTWDMTLFVPSIAKKTKDWRKELDLNRKIRVVYLNITPVEGFQNLSFLWFKRNMGMPRPHNVLIPCIKTSIELNYSKIFLLGADHSWLKELFVAENNEVYLTQKHFYDELSAKPEVMYQGVTNKKRNLAQVLMKFVYSFNSYYILNEYAKKTNVEVLNATKGSYIDAFKRVNLN